MTTTHGDLAAQEQERKRKKRGAIVKFSLAGVALVGIGAAATSAAWTDDAWFKGTANAETKSTDLQASLDGTNWFAANTVADGVAVDIPTTAFEGLLPAESRTVTLYVKNFGTKKLGVTATVATPVTVADQLFSTGGATATLASASFDLPVDDPSTTGVDESVKTDVLTVAAPDWTDATFSGATGTLTVRFTGTEKH
jgi:predicted ribosomally synthesized peptide with SipW-like signal peptide